MDWVRPDDWTPATWSHPAVTDMQAKLDPARMTRHADDWHAAVDRIRDVLTGLSRQVSGQLGENWRGRGADSALESVQRYVTGSLDGLAACRSAATQLAELSRAAGDLRACLIGAERLDDALAHVRQLYSGPAVAAGNAVADIPAPPDPLPIGGASAASVLPAGMPTSAATPAATPVAASVPSVPSVPSAPMQSYDGLSRPDFSSADTQPLWRAPTSSAAVNSPEPLLPRADAPTGTTTPPPAAVPASAADAPRASPRTSPSPAFTPFVGGAYPGMLGRGDGAEHRAARYLVAAGNASELIGELPLVAPPVIGE